MKITENSTISIYNKYIWRLLNSNIILLNEYCNDISQTHLISKKICATLGNYFKLLNIHQKLEWIKNPLIIGVSWTAGCLRMIVNIQTDNRKRKKFRIPYWMDLLKFWTVILDGHDSAAQSMNSIKCLLGFCS